MKKMLIMLPLIAILIFVAGLGLYLWDRDQLAAINRVDHALIGKPVPDFSTAGAGSHAKGFDKQTIAEIQTPVLLNFFASWCVPCLAEHEVISKIGALGGIKVLGVAFDDEPSDTSQWLAKHGNPYDIVGHDDGFAGLTLGVGGVPETFLIDQKGIIVRHFAGPIDDDDAEDMLREVGIDY